MTGQQPPDEPPPEEQQRRRRRWRIRLDSVRADWSVSGGLTLAGTGIGALLVGAFAWIYPHQSQIEVPSLVGLPRIVAEDQLKNTGLALRGTSSEVSDQPTGTVLRSNPSAGTKINQGGAVSVVLAVPGSSESSTVERPPVVPQAPSPPPVEPPIALPPVVEKPPPVVEPPPVVKPPPPVLPPPVVLRQVPDVVGLDRATAERTLTRNELKVGSVTEEESNQRPQTVLRTEPKAGSAVPPKGRVDLIVATCSPRSVPYVVGYELTAAKKRLSDSGLRVGSITEEQSYERPGTVLRVNPVEGAAVQCGGAVKIVVAKSVPIVKVRVPYLVGQDLAAAKKLLADSGLVVGSVTEKQSSQTTQTVLSQKPGPDTTVNPRSAVNLVVAKPQIVDEGRSADEKPKYGGGGPTERGSRYGGGDSTDRGPRYGGGDSTERGSRHGGSSTGGEPRTGGSDTSDSEPGGTVR